MASLSPTGLNGYVPENLPVVITRPRSGAMVGGVCAGLARRWHVDPNLLRISVVVLSFFGGLGLAAYCAGLLLMPRDGQAEMPVRRFLPFTRTWSTPAVVAATIGALVVVVGISSSGGIGLGPVLVIFAIWFFGFRNHGVVARPTPPPEPTPFERAADAWRERMTEQNTPGFESVTLAGPTEQRWTQPYTQPATELVVRDNEPPAVVAERRRRRHLWWLALALVGIGVLVVTVLGLVGFHTGALAYAAAVLAGLGATLVVASRAGRPPLLLPAAILAGLVTAALMGSAAVGPLADVGDVKRAFASGSELAPVNVSAGEVAIDLSRLELDGDRNLDVQVGAGSVDLTLPAGVAAEVTWKVRAGEFDAPGGEAHEGFDLSGTKLYPGAAGSPTLHIRLDVGLGDVTVHR